MKISASPVHTRHRGFDLLRVIAIYMVMQIHTGEFEYISPNGTVLHTAGSYLELKLLSLLPGNKYLIG